MSSRFVTVALLWMLASGPLSPAAARLPVPVEDAIQHVTADELHAHVSILARDKLADRGVGHPGNQHAETYIDRDAQNLVRRSDNRSFLAHGIPAVFLTTGLHPDYHTPNDDTERIDFPKLERITKLAARLAWMAADGEAPRFKVR
jgi:Peptidase family M28